MELIDKAALVAEIEKLYKEDYKFLPSDIVESVQDFKDNILIVLDSLSTVKENYELDAKLTKAIEWLEKQAKKESDPRYENLEELLAADDIYQMSMNDAMVNEAKEKAAKALSELSIGKLLGFEKQGEQKPIYDFNAVDWQPSKVDGKIHNIYNSGVEPKFHEGDWLYEK